MCELLLQVWDRLLLPGIVGALLAIVAEYMPGYIGWAPKWKRAAFFATAIAIPFIAMGCAEIAGCPHPDWQAVLAVGLVVGAAGTLAHIPFIGRGQL